MARRPCPVTDSLASHRFATPDEKDEDMTRSPHAALRAAATALALAGVAAPAFAADGNVVQVYVGHADLNLAEDKDVATLDRRLRQAARQICGFNANDIARRIEAQACLSRTLATATESRSAAIAAAQSGAPRTALASRIVMRAR